ncbi:hypothetical protein CPC08DRAFT_652539 [Agrocybe pediades]|nr:hypothetical protein CPC08DRAFT_652539 [Agrocybe pediades]
MDRTFRSKAITESLLAPERDKGNITYRDYDASLQFLPGMHRYYTFLFTLGSASFFLLPGPKKWKPQRRLAAGASLAMSCYVMGRASELAAHFAFLRSLENPEGFGKAIENVQSQLGQLEHTGLITRPNKSTDDGFSIDENGNVETPSVTSIPDASRVPKTQAAPAAPPSSKWDEIRKKHNPAAHNSAWDAIRQKHEKQQISSEPTPDQQETLWGDDGGDVPSRRTFA